MTKNIGVRLDKDQLEKLDNIIEFMNKQQEKTATMIGLPPVTFNSSDAIRMAIEYMNDYVEEKKRE